MHYQRALSIRQAVVRTMHAGRLGSAAVGRALARVFDIALSRGAAPGSNSGSYVNEGGLIFPVV